ncbi:hypothetical protein F2Q68_00040739 [Brassica cretica]|uniref:Transmembrane protein n=1 Tax=Brassica cretica TaxID=69181 RepID=A0A8S9MJ38_BRACR|nr:hypothetical protein F2Q68_00040739 [Brassica cretica]
MTAGFDSDDLPSSPVESLAYLRDLPEFCPVLMAKAFWRLLSQFLSSLLAIFLFGFLFRFVSGGTHDWRLSETFLSVKSSDGGVVLDCLKSSDGLFFYGVMFPMCSGGRPEVAPKPFLSKAISKAISVETSLLSLHYLLERGFGTVGRLLAPVVCVFLKQSNPASGSGGASSSPMTAGFDSDDLPSSPVESLAYLRDLPEFCSVLMAKAFWRLLSQFLSSLLTIFLFGFLFRFVSGGTLDWRLSETFLSVKSSDGGVALDCLKSSDGLFFYGVMFPMCSGGRPEVAPVMTFFL